MRWGWVWIIMEVVVTDEEGSDPRASAARAWYTPYHTTHLSSVRRLIREWTRYQPSFVKMEICMYTCIEIRIQYEIKRTLDIHSTHPSGWSLWLFPPQWGFPSENILCICLCCLSIIPQTPPPSGNNQQCHTPSTPHCFSANTQKIHPTRGVFSNQQFFGWVVICINWCPFLFRYIGSSEFKIDVELLSQLSD